MKARVSIRWTATAKRLAKGLPRKVRVGILEKIDGLKTCDPCDAHKPLTGILRGCYTIKYSRYRVIYKAEKVVRTNGEVFVHVKVIVLAAGIRKENDKNDVYQLAQKLIGLGLIGLQADDESN